MLTHEGDLELVRRLVSGDEGAAEVFVRDYLDWVRDYARYKNVPAQDCADIAQDVFRLAFGQLQRGLFRGESSLKTWLSKIADGAIADYRRLRGPGGAALLPLTVDGHSQGEGDSRVALVEVYAPPERRELALLVRQAVQTLSHEHRVVLLLNVRGGYTIKEISRRLDLPGGTVGRILAEAKDRFRRFVRGGAEKAGRMQ
jgi:RNA polymerase sigma-70 factor, ECF subfamily